MQTTFEQIIELARQLSPEEFDKLCEWARQQRFILRQTNEKSTGVKEDVRKFNLAMNWIREHQQEYLGQWVCLDGDNLISFGTDALKVHNEAKAVGISAPFLKQIVEEPEFFSDGWESCQET